MNTGSLVAIGVGAVLVPMGVFVMLRPERVRELEKNYCASSLLSYRLVLIDRPGYLWYLRFAGGFLIVFGGLGLLIGIVSVTR